MHKVLFVVPSETSSGEAITALQAANDMAANGDDIHIVGSALAARIFGDAFADRLSVFGGDVAENQRRWSDLLDRFLPEVIVFADYPLLTFPTGAIRLWDPRWLKELIGTRIPLVTTDHLGYAQRGRHIFFGPPHRALNIVEVPETPAEFTILLPSPMQLPWPDRTRRGIPFRSAPLREPRNEARRQQVRSRYLDEAEGYLVLHSTPGWARDAAQRLALSYYDYYEALLRYYFALASLPVTVVSINDGALLANSGHPNLRIVNLPRQAVLDFEDLLDACDLMITDNSISSSLGKAILHLTPCAVLVNSFTLHEIIERADATLRSIVQDMEKTQPGSIFPFAVFPIWKRDDVDELGIFRENPLAGGFATVELFGGETSRRTLLRLLEESTSRAALIAKQSECVRDIGRLPTAHMVLAERILHRSANAG